MENKNEKSASNIANNIRSLTTSDIDVLAQFQKNKNRRYTQLQAGKFQSNYVEVNLNGLQIFHEKISAGSLIEAAPHNSILPFAALLTPVSGFNFCGKESEQGNILQATGGFWDANFKHGLNVVAAAFNRESFECDIQRLTGQQVPHDWLISKSNHANTLSLNRYAKGLDSIISIIQKSPDILVKNNANNMLCDTILRLLLNTLNINRSYLEGKVSQSNRFLGVRRVIDYLHHYSDEVPTIPQLCRIAELSERNLQYGFKEYLGVTPIRYLRVLRLNRVRRELLISDHQKHKVVDIALNWGFIELGRFAGEYRKLFHELPSDTLHK
jgi:AraC family ethanolamine operon transcriptional activator